MTDETGEKKSLKLPIVLGILLVFAALTALYYYRQFTNLRKNPQQVAQQETAEVVRLVSKHILLPEGEDPTLATVTDADKLKDQPFFAHAKIGDKVLIYTNARKAILYNPSSDKLVEVAPLNIGNPSQ